jgi:hypothetical protein
VDAVVVDGELWYVTEAGAVRRQALDRVSVPSGFS